jgi:hypothetical protein
MKATTEHKEARVDPKVFDGKVGVYQLTPQGIAFPALNPVPGTLAVFYFPGCKLLYGEERTGSDIGRLNSRLLFISYVSIHTFATNMRLASLTKIALDRLLLSRLRS